ncbi:MAG: lipopolysaccharide heptosyltransferase II [Nitrospirota bacterium]|nr:lipopolysaccharide heptosyltransferase II [Nitrospirota bacterium]
MKLLRDGALKTIFGGLKAISPRNSPERRDYKNARFLVISTTAIGDTLLATPAMRALKETYPGSYVAVLAHKGRMDILKGNPHVDELISFEKGWIPLWQMGQGLKRRGFNVVLIFHGNDPWTLPVAWLSGAPEIVGYREDTEFDSFLTRIISMPAEGSHAIDRRLALSRAVGADTKDRKLVLRLTESERASTDDLLSMLEIDRNRPLVGLQPGAARPYKCWPLERFAELGRRLVEELGAQVVITGSPQEAAMADRLKKMIGEGAASAAGRTEIRGMGVLMEQMAAYVTNDTGPMHMAFALGTPTVALFCPSDAASLGPSAEQEKHRMLSKPLTCTPCITKRCTDPFCMEQFSVDEVAEAVRQLMRTGKNR